MQLSDLAQQRCQAGRTALPEDDLTTLIGLLPGWQLHGKEIVKTFKFANYYETLAFVNAMAWIAHSQDHHPDLGVHFNRCKVVFSTHDAGGLTLNDFICAARVEALTLR